MPESPASEPEVLVVAGSERVRVTGRAALIIAQVVLRASAINRIPVGRLVADFAHAKTRIEMTESFAALRIDLGVARSPSLLREAPPKASNALQ